MYVGVYYLKQGTNNLSTIEKLMACIHDLKKILYKINNN